MSSCTPAEIAEKKRIALEKLRAKQAQSISLSNVNKSPPKRSPAALEFLNALKQSTKFTFRQDTRDSAHPYQRTKVKNNEPSAPSYNPTISAQKLTPQQQQQQIVAPVFTQKVSCKIYMISPMCFAVQPSSYHQKLIDVFKTIPSKCFDAQTKIWNFAIKDYKLVQNRVNELKPEVVIGIIPKAVIQLCQTSVEPMHHSCLNSIEKTLAQELFKFQEKGVCFGIGQNGRVMICDEMGLGKTYQALAIADYYREDWPLLICTTAAVRDSWAGHVRRLLPSLAVHYIQILSNNQQYFGDAKVLITSYHMLERVSNKLVDHKFGCLIFDESHTLKNPKAKCTIVADRLASQAKRVILLSGTPALSRPAELFTQIHMIDRKFMTFIDFTSRYCDGKQTHFGWDASGQSNLDELNVVLRLKFMIRRTKAEVLPELAQKNRETICLDPTLYNANQETLASLSSYSKGLSASKGKARDEILLKFYARTAEVKIPAVCAHLKTVLKDKIKFIVFAHHRVMIEAICKFLLESKVHFIRIDGATKSESRTEFINSFQTRPNCRAAVLSLKACNAGITLTAAELIIFAELDWNPSTLAQAEGRAHRIGQMKPLICRYLLATNTADDFIWNMLKTKQETLQKTGIFCENLQDATHSTASISTKNTLDRHFPKADRAEEHNGKNSSSNKNVDRFECNNNKNHIVTETKELTSKAGNNKSFNLKNELENIEDIFTNDDDDITEDVVNKELENLEDIFNDFDKEDARDVMNKEIENLEDFFTDGENVDDQDQEIIKKELADIKVLFNDDVDDDVFEGLNF